jgi:hypothetical protein
VKHTDNKITADRQTVQKGQNFGQVAGFFLVQHTTIESVYQTTKKNIPNGHKIPNDLINSKYTKTLHAKTYTNIPKLGFLECKYAIWQPLVELANPTWPSASP